MTTRLNQIQENSLHESALSHYSNSFSVSELKIDYSIDVSALSIRFQITLAGVNIGGGTIDPSHPTMTIGGGVAGFKAEVTITADFTNKEVEHTTELCVPGLGCKDHNGTLFAW